jgi:hypothetical protein
MLCLLLIGIRKKRRERETDRQTERKAIRGFIPKAGGQTCLAGCARQDFCGCYMQLKAEFRVSL